MKMHIRPLSIVCSALLLAACATPRELAPTGKAGSPPLAVAPPVAPVEPVTDTYHGVEIVDPYRWMEDLKDPRTQAWMKAHADYADAQLKALPERNAILAELHKYGDVTYPVGTVQRRGDRWFYLRMKPGANVQDLVTRAEAGAPETLVFDPGAITDGQRWSIATYTASPDGRHVIVQVAPDGGEKAVTRVVETTTGKDLGLLIDRTHGDDLYAPQWLDDRSFLYFRLRDLPADASPTDLYKKSRAYLHRLHMDGTADDPDRDRAIFGHALDPAIDIAEDAMSVVYAPSGSDWLLARSATVAQAGAYWVAPRKSLERDGRIPWRSIAAIEDQVSDVAIRGDTAWLLSARDASHGRLLRLDLRQPSARAELAAPEGKAVLSNLAVTRNAVYAQGLDAGLTRLWKLDEAAHQLRPILRADDSSAYLVLGANDAGSGDFVYTLESYAHGRRYFRQRGNGEGADIGLAPPNQVDRSRIEVKLAFAPSYDGVQVPVMIAHRRGLPRDGRNPTLVFGYGAYGMSLIDPSRWPEMLPWFDRGGVIALAGVRGGGEYGEDWHRAGMQATKPNTWKDAIAVAEYLVREGYTAPAHLAVGGGSAGGILAGNAIVERPDLFSAALIQVGLTDALRFETTANGPINVPEFGSVATREGFDALRAMDAYQKVKDGVAYPAVLLTHGINDPRVEPWFSAKMAARLQAASSSGKPVLLRIDYADGHGVGSGRDQREAEFADILAFLLQRLGGKR